MSPSNISFDMGCDTREQAPYEFEKYDCVVKRVPLYVGDYAPIGFEQEIARERKELNDLISCLMGKNRERFCRELWRAFGMDFAVIIEASLEDIRNHNYRSKMLPHAALQSMAALERDYKMRFIYAGDRAGGEYLIYSAFQKHISKKQKECREIQKMLKTNSKEKSHEMV